MVTTDPAGCQQTIVQDLRAAGADHVLAVKCNQSTLHAEARAARYLLHSSVGYYLEGSPAVLIQVSKG